VILIDSSGWIEYFRGTPLGERYREYVRADDTLVPTVVLLEVYKIMLRDDSQQVAELAAAQLRKKTVTDLDEGLALHAAEVGLERRLAMADAVIYAAALEHEATLVTSDRHLADLPGVVYLPKTPATE
jgi:predicted nucleic acid-binding protein